MTATAATTAATTATTATSSVTRWMTVVGKMQWILTVAR
jgi:hypothetical protein